VIGVFAWTALAGGTQPYATYELTVAADGPVAQYRFDDGGWFEHARGFRRLLHCYENSGIVLGGEGPFGGSKSGSFRWFGVCFAAVESVGWRERVLARGGSTGRVAPLIKQPIFDFGSKLHELHVFDACVGAHEPHDAVRNSVTTAGTVFQVTAPTLKSKAWEYVAVTETSSGTLTLYLKRCAGWSDDGCDDHALLAWEHPDDYLGKSLVSGEPSFNGDMSNVAFYNKRSRPNRSKPLQRAKFPVNTVLPTVSGTPQDGQTLTGRGGHLDGADADHLHVSVDALRKPRGLVREHALGDQNDLQSDAGRRRSKRVRDRVDR